jgi:hypothetical protein
LPVMLQSFKDEFGVEKECKANLPAKPGQILVQSKAKDVLDEQHHAKYRSGVGKLCYLATWSRPDILNAVREISRQLKAPNKMHYDAMIHAMKFCMRTVNRGQKVELKMKWDRDREFEFFVSRMSDSNFNQCPDTRKSVSGNITELNSIPVLVKSVMQETMKLSVT